MNKIMGKIVGNTTATPFIPKINEPYIPKECTVTDDVAWSFELCKSAKSTEGVTWFSGGSNSFTIVSDADPFRDVTVIFYNPKTGNMFLCENPAYLRNEDGVYELDFIVKDGYTNDATTLEDFKKKYTHFGEYVGEYKWKKQCDIDKEYVDTSIQQAILDSWGCEV